MMAKSDSMNLKNYFSETLKQIISYLSAIPDSKVWDSVKRMERLTIAFNVVRNGLDQSNCTDVNIFGYRKYKLIDWTIAITSLINVMRITVLIHDSRESVGIYLGDFFFRSKDRLPCLIWASMAIAIMFAFREWILYLEAKGKVEVLSVWKGYLDNINMTNLQMNDLNMNRFRLTIYSVSLLLSNMMKAVPIFVPILFFTPLLTNPWTYKIPRLAFFGTIWLFSAIFACIFLLNAIIGFGWYALCSLIFHLFRLLDLLDLANNLLNSNNINNNNYLQHNSTKEKNIKSLCLTIISRLNSFEFAADKLRYVLLCYIFLYSVVGDVYIYLGVILRVYSDFLANLLAVIGFIILPAIGVSGLVFGSAITELNNLTGKLHQLTINSKISVNTMNKVLEIMDRVAGPYNGVKVGDFFTLEKTFFILFILENISTLMLFTVNIGPLIQT